MTTLLHIKLQTQRYKVCFSVAHIIIRCIKSITKTAMTELQAENPLFVWQAVLVIEISSLDSEPALHFKSIARIFYGEVRSNEETDETMPKAQVSRVGRIRLPETAFEYFEKLGISQTFNLQKYIFFSNRVLYFTIF